MAGPVFPMGKNSSGSSSRQAARSRQSMLIVLLDEAVGVVRTGAGLVVGREWLRKGEPVAALEGRGARYWRAVLLLILVVMSSCVSSSSRGWGSWARGHALRQGDRLGLGLVIARQEYVTSQLHCFLVGAGSA